MTSPPPPDWNTYFDAVAGQPARETLLEALRLFDADPPSDSPPPRHAVDLGCGSGRDTLELLRRGWTVTALDQHPEAIRRLLADAPPEHAPRLRTITASYEDADWPAADLINASFSIPHCREGRFPVIWQRIAGTLRPGARFAGQLFGVRDGWATPTPTDAPPLSGWRDGRQFHTREQVLALLAEADLEPEHLREQEGPGRTALGDPKYWHVFHIVARRRYR